MVYSLAQNAEAAPFAINAATGAITLASLLDWEDKTLWQPTVIVMDASASPLNTTLVVSVVVTDVNDASITGLSVLAASVAADLGANVNSSSPFFAAFGDAAILLRAAGGARVVISGANLGLTQRRLTAEGLTVPAQALVAASSGPAAAPSLYAATACAITVPNTQITCTAAAGVGASQRPAAIIGVMLEPQGGDVLDWIRHFHVPQLAHEIVIAHPAAEPAEKQIAARLHQPLAHHHALAVVGQSAGLGVGLQHGRAGLLDLQNQGMPIIGQVQGNETAGADAADSHHLESHILQGVTTK
jgi:hypothetical protein